MSDSYPRYDPAAARRAGVAAVLVGLIVLAGLRLVTGRGRDVDLPVHPARVTRPAGSRNPLLPWQTFRYEVGAGHEEVSRWYRETLTSEGWGQEPATWAGAAELLPFRRGAARLELRLEPAEDPTRILVSGLLTEHAVRR